MDNLLISLDEVKQLSSELRKLNEEISLVLSKSEKDMQSLSGVWESEGSKTIRERFVYFAKRFKEQALTIEAYARFLDYTVSSYESLESTITQNATNVG